jgi:hypothetical protein
MIVAIMQPYFFPYIGYFQLMRAVDAFVFYDDVQFIKRGWINRNRILVGNQPSWLTLPMKHDGQTVNINRRNYLLGKDVESTKGKLQSAYASAPAFKQVYPFVRDLLDFDNPNVALFNANLLCRMAQCLGISCRFATSSEIAQPDGLRGEAKIIYLCKALGADHYINPIGGVELYDRERFAEAGLRLSFLRTTSPPTRFDGGEAHLSIIDTMMRVGPSRCREQLIQYELLDEK